MRIFAIFLFILASHASRAQRVNLVVNPSFEIQADSTRPLNPENDLQTAYGWSNPGTSHPKIFTTVQQGTESVIFDPYGSIWGFNARTGANVAGIDVRGPLDRDTTARAYLQGTLQQPLTVGKKYIFGFWVHYHCEGANNIGIAFLPEPMKSAYNDLIPLEPVTYQKRVTPYNRERSWTLVRDSFIALKPYRHFIIGNFFPDSMTYVQSCTFNHYFAFIDDIFVEESLSQPARPPKPPVTDEEKWFHNDIVSSPKHIAILLENIFFAFDSDQLLPASAPSLNQLLRQLELIPTMKIRINGHTSTEGNPEHNLVLSDLRARAIKAYLVTHGISPSRVETMGYGQTRPVVEDNSEEMRKKNRRVEFEILE
jgi:outer membrane protein OmpA-like peptidoglycan-associated protein